MKRWVLFLMLSVLMLTACQSTPTQAPDIPRYTADQVITIVKAANTYEGKYPSKGQYELSYIGSGVWTITYKYDYSYSYYSGNALGFGTNHYRGSWHFYEADGRLVQDYLRREYP